MKLLRSVPQILCYALLASVVLFLLAPINDAIRNQVTVYPVLKTKEGKLLPLNRSIYKVFPETQTVISWFPGITEVPSKLAKCSVRDRLHWRCEYSDGSGTLTMDNKRFQILSKDNLPERDIQYVSRLKWWMLHL
jgi:hypothetical protein